MRSVVFVVGLLACVWGPAHAEDASCYDVVLVGRIVGFKNLDDLAGREDLFPSPGRADLFVLVSDQLYGVDAPHGLWTSGVLVDLPARETSLLMFLKRRDRRNSTVLSDYWLVDFRFTQDIEGLHSDSFEQYSPFQRCER